MEVTTLITNDLATVFYAPAPQLCHISGEYVFFVIYAIPAFNDFFGGYVRTVASL